MKMEPSDEFVLVDSICGDMYTIEQTTHSADFKLKKIIEGKTSSRFHKKHFHILWNHFNLMDI